MADAAIDLVNRYYRHFNAGELDVYPDLFTADATLEAPGAVTGTGPAAMQAFDGVWREASTDFQVTALVQVARDGSVVSENLAEGTHTGTLVTPAGSFPATGNAIGGKYVGVFEIREGRIAAQRIYFDRAGIMEQLGLIPVPAAR